VPEDTPVDPTEARCTSLRCAASAPLAGEPVFDNLARHPDESAGFDEDTTGFSSNVAPAVAGARESAAFGTVVDVGGDLFRGVPAGGDAVRGPDDDRGLPFPFLRH
jgi:hypothetical protein